MRTSWLPVLVLLTIAGCYERDDVCVGGDCRGEDDGIPEIVLDDDPGAPEADTDGDGLANGVDTDDDDDGIQDDADVDVDGDGLVEAMPPTDVVEAARVALAGQCQQAQDCCIDYLARGSTDDLYALCMVDGQLAALVAGFAQAAATAGAEVDPAAWQEERGSSTPKDWGLPDACPSDVTAGKGLVVRIQSIDEMLLPWFHGVRLVGETCFTLWDCEREARCEGLAEGEGDPGTCAPRPREGRPCAQTEPYCPSWTVCSVLDEGTVCERPRGENDFCRAFELGGRLTDNCDARHWCDESLETPACRPVLREGDPCDEDRQCITFECTVDGCPPLVADWRDNADTFMPAWCDAQYPGAEPDGGWR